MPRPVFPRAAAVVVAVLAAGLVAGCGGSSHGPAGAATTSAPPPAPSATAGAPSPETTSGSAAAGATGGAASGRPAAALRSSLVASTRVTTARMRLRSVVSVNGQQVVVTSAGAFDSARKRGRFLITLPGGRSVTVVFADGRAYVTVPGAGPAFRVPLEQLADGGLSDATDPTQALQVLRGVGDGVRSTGSATVDGTRTTRYTGVIDVQRALARLGADARALRKKLAQLEGARVPFEAYVDGRGLLRRFVERITVRQGSQSLRSVTTLDLDGYGQPVTVTVPRRTQDGSGLAGQLGAG